MEMHLCKCLHLHISSNMRSLSDETSLEYLVSQQNNSICRMYNMCTQRQSVNFSSFV